MDVAVRIDWFTFTGKKVRSLMIMIKEKRLVYCVRHALKTPF